MATRERRDKAGAPTKQNEWEAVTWDPKRRDTRTWQEWKEDLFWAQVYRLRGHPGLAPLEQYMFRSKTEKRCVECGESGVVRWESALLKHVGHYWVCCRCANYWACRTDEERGPVRMGDVYAGYPCEIEVYA